jgi:hypothetical protein
MVMEDVALIFSSKIDLGNFELLIESNHYTIINNGLTIIGSFTDREIELAVNAYKAKVVDVNSNEILS